MSATAIVRADESASVVRRVLTSSIGLKIIMAVTGVVLSGFVLLHMIGNLIAFTGAEAMDAYAAALRKVPAALWGIRIVLLASVILHIWAYIKLTFTSLGARSKNYQKVAHQESTLASRTMRWTGPLLAVFIVYHILHMTTGTVHPQFEEGKVYANLLSGLQVTWVLWFYLVAMGALAVHLHHGIWSLFQSIGISQPRYASFGRRLATAFTIVVAGGFVLIPLAILMGLLK